MYNIEQVLQGLPRFHENPGLSRMEIFARENDIKTDAYTVIIGGTNGKGSTSAMLSGALTSAGYSTGVMNSPHVYSPGERLLFSGEPIDEDDFANLIKYAINFFDKRNIKATLADITTACAMLHFTRNHKPDVIILEVGMGGRLDPVNYFPRNLAVVTGVGHDHTNILGAYPNEIAHAKAGIIQGNIPFITGEINPVIREIFGGICRERKSPYIQAQEAADVIVEPDGTRFSCGGGNYKTGIIGFSQGQNGALVLEVVNLMKKDGFNIPNNAIKQGFRSARLPWRMEKFSSNPPIYFDGSHNREGWENLARTLAFFPHQNIHIILFIQKTKDPAHFPGSIPGKNVTLYLPRIQAPGYHSPESLAGIICLSRGEKIINDNLNESVSSIINTTGPRDLILAAGSFSRAVQVRDVFKL